MIKKDPCENYLSNPIETRTFLTYVTTNIRIT